MKSFVKNIDFQQDNIKLIITLDVKQGVTLKINDVLISGLGLSEDLVEGVKKTRLFMGLVESQVECRSDGVSE